MSLRQYLIRHMIVVICLLMIGYGIVAYIHIVCPEKIGQPYARGVQVAFAPVYNEDGSTFHAKIDIGYRQGLLILESIVSVFCIWILYKLFLYYSIFFGMTSKWTYFADFGCATAIARLPVRLAGKYVLDYLYIRMGHGVYDFFDLCIGVSIVGMVLWYIPCCVRYHRYKKAHTKGMKFREKFRWEMRFGFDMLKKLFCPLRTWWRDVS